jgi:hypothetical protein
MLNSQPMNVAAARPTYLSGKRRIRTLSCDPPRLRRLIQQKCASCHAIDGQLFIIDSGCCVVQRLLEIFDFEKGVLGEQRSAVGISRKQFENAANRDPHPPDTRLPAALSRLNRNPIKQVYRCHMLSLDYGAPLRCRIVG